MTDTNKINMIANMLYQLKFNGAAVYAQNNTSTKEQAESLLHKAGGFLIDNTSYADNPPAVERMISLSIRHLYSQ